MRTLMNRMNFRLIKVHEMVVELFDHQKTKNLHTLLDKPGYRRFLCCSCL